MALADSCEPPNIGGLTAGTPPGGGDGPSSQIAALPLPRARDGKIWNAGSVFGSFGFELNVDVAGGRRLIPSRTSTMTKKPWATCRSKIREPSGAVPADGTGCPSARARPM